jgi:hypothetical protein
MKIERQVTAIAEANIAAGEKTETERERERETETLLMRVIIS